ncbi:hypothetical protein SLH49_05245 [Cognatiyoonia sp. IB215446]|uniref:hypothetical protein n=1 Tax=Cognatiyoonia sp. IB215446 TaxID=3097355 RepID=UPI002A10847F|nr:hypothetical protein [Cognatiyoonia sp. IB215446]MDX8347387.1 hypothetical protein [Cognatiyoonia sp. IB215446]
MSLWFLHGVSADFLRDEFSQENLGKLYHESMWLSIGTHSLVLVCRDGQLDLDIRNTCADNLVPFERWLIDQSDAANSFIGSEVEYYSPEQYFSPKENRKTKLAVETLSNASIEADDALEFMQIELCALLSVIEGRSRGPYSVLVDDAKSIESLASDLFNGHDKEDEHAVNAAQHGNGRIDRPDLLLTLNAGLSRLASQALSGTSPILRTECHFWPHSFLGTGVANLALRNVASFLTSLTEDVKYDQRVNALGEKAFLINDYPVTKFGSHFPDFFSLERNQVSKSNNLDEIPLKLAEEFDEEVGEAATPITFFSGRDGFMNGALTTSAPLPSVLGGNSYQWNLGTITHEISHRILGGHIFDLVDGFLAAMLELQNSGPVGCREINEYFQDAPTTYSDYASKMLGRSLMLLSCLDFDESDMRRSMSHPFDFFIEVDERHTGDLEELLVHIFDYYHFYGTNAETYCSFVWLSWAVLPAIQERLFEYVVRTLVALGVKFIGRDDDGHAEEDDWRELAIADFCSVLAQEPLLSRLPMRKEIEGFLNDQDKREEILHYLETYEPLLVVFHMFFKSNKLRINASKDRSSNPHNRSVVRNGHKEKRYYHYRFPANVFVSEKPSIGKPKFSNPLLFLRDYSREEVPSAAQSAWLLHMLAFNLQNVGGQLESEV